MKRSLFVIMLLVGTSIPARGQVHLGVGGGLTSIPHSGQTNCEGKRSAPTSTSVELRLGTRISRTELNVRGARVFGLDDTMALDCFYPPNTEFNSYTYDRGKPDQSWDMNGWYELNSLFRVGAEVGVFPGAIRFAGAGAAMRAGALAVEALARVHHVKFTQSRMNSGAGPSVTVLSVTEKGTVEPGFSIRGIVILDVLR